MAKDMEDAVWKALTHGSPSIISISGLPMMGKSYWLKRVDFSHWESTLKTWDEVVRTVACDKGIRDIYCKSPVMFEDLVERLERSRIVCSKSLGGMVVSDRGIWDVYAYSKDVPIIRKRIELDYAGGLYDDVMCVVLMPEDVGEYIERLERYTWPWDNRPSDMSEWGLGQLQLWKDAVNDLQDLEVPHIVYKVDGYFTKERYTFDTVLCDLLTKTGKWIGE